jgi:DNA polymerase III epsilon subunit family exonuclease
MKYVVFDIETTGLDIINDRIIEIGALKVEDGEIIDEFNMLMNPGVSIPPTASAINNITDDMLVDAPHSGVVLTYFHRFIKDVDFLVGHNAKRFDVPFLETEFVRHGILYEPIKVKDTVWEARRTIKGLHSYSLASLCNVFQIENKNAHRALSDVYATHELYLNLLKRKRTTSSV